MASISSSVFFAGGVLIGEPGQPKILVLLAPHPVDRVSQMPCDAALVEYDVSVRLGYVGPSGGDKECPHVHRDALETRASLWTQILDVALQSLLPAIIDHMQHKSPLRDP